MPLEDYKQGDSAPPLETRLTVDGERLDDLDEAVEVRLYVDDEDAGELLVNDVMTIVDVEDALVRYEWGEQLGADPGTYRVEIVVEYDDGRVRTIPREGYHRLRINETTDREAPDADFDDPDASLTRLFVDELHANVETAITLSDDVDGSAATIQQVTLDDPTVEGTLTVNGSATVSDAPTANDDVVRKQEADALQSDIDDVDTDLQGHKSSSEAHGADGDLQGANDVDATVESHRTTETHTEPQPPAEHASDHHEDGDDELRADLTASDPTADVDRYLATDGTGGWKLNEEPAGVSVSQAEEIAFANTIDALDIPSGADAVSLELADGESTAVPTGETWFTYISIGTDTVNNEDYEGTLLVDNERVMWAVMVDGSSSGYESHAARAILAEGTNLDVVGTNAGASISGFDVSGAISNDAVTHALGDTDSVTVPSGETWKVRMTIGHESGRNESGMGTILKNNVPIAHSKIETDSTNAAPDITYAGEAVLVAGDELSFETDQSAASGALVSGWVID